MTSPKHKAITMAHLGNRYLVLVGGLCDPCGGSMQWTLIVLHGERYILAKLFRIRFAFVWRFHWLTFSLRYAKIQCSPSL
ncbi:hypothetical protein SCLCIDRAFT_1218511 [Scleroderma citrinum Foug A]|uniref:Uncharacterized protein n=1 Tax=Scleroderma citrinum Foug A TaxID=1036808 RepID=A0A0C3DRD5_9AGAM|nr:hypothetical protein SCLCIDRAFT_1218511 [Scleroderma citrinum Foug A]